MTEPTDAAEKGWVADKARIVKTEKNGWCAFLDIEDEDGQRIGSINICRGINSHDAAAALVRNWVRDLSASLYTTPQPTQAQAGAVPLTPEQITAAAKKLAECMDYPWEYMAHGGRAEMHKIAKAVIEAAGIKGGQHGAE